MNDFMLKYSLIEPFQLWTVSQEVAKGRVLVETNRAPVSEESSCSQMKTGVRLLVPGQVPSPLPSAPFLLDPRSMEKTGPQQRAWLDKEAEMGQEALCEGYVRCPAQVLHHSRCFNGQCRIEI